jgi:hypothetical protein
MLAIRHLVLNKPTQSLPGHDKVRFPTPCFSSLQSALPWRVDISDANDLPFALWELVAERGVPMQDSAAGKVSPAWLGAATAAPFLPTLNSVHGVRYGLGF